MPSVCALRGKLVLMVLAACSICLVPPAFVWNTPRFDPIQCPDVPTQLGFPQLANARCGSLVVPEDRKSTVRSYHPAVCAIIPAQSGKSVPDPVVYLGSGPGGIAIVESTNLINSEVNRNRNLVVMNQRGQFLSIPALTCAPIEDFARQLLSLRFYSESTKREHLRATADCHRELLTTGANLPVISRFEALRARDGENAADFADIRTVLGIPEWNVLGGSYGTDLAQMYVRDHPEGIRSVVLDSVIPVNPFRGESGNDWFRRTLSVPARSGGGRLTERTPTVQSRRRERVKVPQSSHCPSRTPTAQLLAGCRSRSARSR